MMDLLGIHFLWSSLGWLCLLGLSLWLIAVLFPVPGSSVSCSLEDATNREPKESAPISCANQILYVKKRENR